MKTFREFLLEFIGKSGVASYGSEKNASPMSNEKALADKLTITTVNDALKSMQKSDTLRNHTIAINEYGELDTSKIDLNNDTLINDIANFIVLFKTKFNKVKIKIGGTPKFLITPNDVVNALKGKKAIVFYM